MQMKTQGDTSKIMRDSETDSLRNLLSQGLILLGLEYPERFGILMALKTKNQVWEMAWWIRQNLERKPSQKEIMDQFERILKLTQYNSK